MTNSTDIVVPDLGEFSDVEVIEILVSAGDKVAREDGLITLETDKAAMDVPAPADGVIEAITVAVGDRVSTGSVIGKMMQEVGDTVVTKPALSEDALAENAAAAAPPEAKPAAAEKQTLVVPDIGEFDDVEIIEVHIAAGDNVDVEDPLVTLETDKAAMDVPAVVAGTIDDVLVKVGDKVSEGTSLATINASASAGAAPSPSAPATTSPPAPAPAAAASSPPPPPTQQAAAAGRLPA
ncbi:MAG: hypothetical protein KJO82_15385, partial [Gammaproteobacteria bacterium]|nr:hypothetical protein [Gammaproteobacteria bacterium]